MKSLVLFLIFSVLSGANAFAVQHFTCFPPDVNSNDRAVIALKSATEGTLFLTSGLDDWGNQDTSGVLLLNKTGEKDDKQIWVANNTKSTFTAEIPKKHIGVNADSVKIKLNLKSSNANVDQELDCYTRMY